MSTRRYCHLCQTLKWEGEFSRDTASCCQTCDNLRESLRPYGLSLTDYRLMLSAHSGLCAICRKPPPDGERLHVDHDHVIGKVRGLLCRQCNTGLGMFRDDRELLLQALVYLELR